MMHDGELRLAFQRIAQTRRQLEEIGLTKELGELIDVLQTQEEATREAYIRSWERAWGRPYQERTSV